MSKRLQYFLIGLGVLMLVLNGFLVYDISITLNQSQPNISAAVATSAQPVTQPDQGWSADPLNLDGDSGQGWSVDPLGLDERKSDVVSNGETDLTWLGNLGKILLLAALAVFGGRVLSVSRAKSHGENDGLAKWLGATWGAIFGPSPWPSLLLWASNLVAAIFAALVIFFFWSDILVICLIPAAIFVAILFWVGKGALVGEALEGIFTGVIIKKIIKDPAKSAEEARQDVLAKLYKELHDNDEAANPEREETIKKEIAVLRGEKS